MALQVCFGKFIKGSDQAFEVVQQSQRAYNLPGRDLVECWGPAVLWKNFLDSTLTRLQSGTVCPFPALVLLC